MNAVDNKRRQRLEWLMLAKGYAERAYRLMKNDETASEAETERALGSCVSLRDWFMDLEQDLTWKSMSPDLSGVHEDVVRLGAKLDKIETLFERLAEQDHARLVSRNRFEQTAALQLQALRSAVTLLLSREAPSLADKVQAAKAIRDASSPSPNTGAQS